MAAVVPLNHPTQGAQVLGGKRSCFCKQTNMASNNYSRLPSLPVLFFGLRCWSAAASFMKFMEHVSGAKHFREREFLPLLTPQL